MHVVDESITITWNICKRNTINDGFHRQEATNQFDKFRINLCWQVSFYKLKSPKLVNGRNKLEAKSNKQIKWFFKQTTYRHKGRTIKKTKRYNMTLYNYMQTVKFLIKYKAAMQIHKQLLQFDQLALYPLTTEKACTKLSTMQYDQRQVLR